MTPVATAKQKSRQAFVARDHEMHHELSSDCGALYRGGWVL